MLNRRTSVPSTSVLSVSIPSASIPSASTFNTLRHPARAVRASLTLTGVVVALVAGGCQSYGSGPQPRTREEKVAACGTLPAGYRENIHAQQLAYSKKHLSAAEQRTLKIDVSEAYPARSYRGLMNYGRFKYGWAAPVSITWMADAGKPRTIHDAILMFPGELEAPVASTIPGLQIERVE